MTLRLYGFIALAAVCSAAAAQPTTTAPAQEPTRVKLMALDYAGAEVTDVLRALAAQSGANVVINPGVKGQVTVHLREKTVDEAMVFVASLAGAGAKRVNGTYIVAPRADMRQTVERLGVSRRVAVTNLAPQSAADMLQAAFPDLTARPQGKGVAMIGATEDLDAAERLLRDNDVLSPDDTRVVEKVTLKHRQPTQAAAAIVKMIPGITAEPAGDTVVVAGTKTQVDTARRSLDLLDTEGAPTSEMRVYKVRYMPAAQLMALVTRSMPEVQVFTGPESIAPAPASFNPISSQFQSFQTTNNQQTSTANGGPNGTAAAGAAAAADPNAAVVVNPKALTLLLKGSPDALDQALKVLALVDVAPRQMIIEAKVVETQPSLDEKYGLQWSWTRFGFYESPAGTHVTAQGDGIGTDFTDFVTKRLGLGQFSRVPWSFQSILNAMITKRDARLLANPSISVIDDADASIFIGDTLRYQALATSSPTTGSQFTVVEVPVGIILLVHPRVNDEGNITLRIHPVVSTVTGLVNGLPQTSAREAETTVRVKDGDTLVIGGLIRDEDLKEVQKLPILGDLPVLGSLFRNTQHTHNRTEVMVVLTIHMVKQP